MHKQPQTSEGEWHRPLVEPKFEVNRHLTDKVREVEQIAPHCREAIRNCSTAQSPWPLVLHGEPGSGKTCAALCMLDRWSGLYFTLSSLVRRAQLAKAGELRDPYWTSLDEVYRSVFMAPLFVLDEVGTRSRPSEHEYDVLYQVVDGRAGKPLVLITNVDLPNLTQLYDGRLTSRLSPGTFVHMKGDRRQPAKPKGS
jgi:DNA replication protein DnaC